MALAGVGRLAFRGLRGRIAQVTIVVVGVAVATAIAVGAAVLASSFGESVLRSVETQLGPVQVEVVRAGLDPPVAPDGALPITTVTTTVRGRDAIARVARAQIVEVDFERARQFGGDSDATGISGATPAGDRAVLGADLADAIAIEPGHRVTVYLGGQERTFTIDRLLPRLGIAGLRPPDGALPTSGVETESLNLFVPIGTISSMLTTPEAIDAAKPISLAAVDAAEAHLVDGRPDAVAVRQQLAADSRDQAHESTALFRALASFAVVGGVVLLGISFGALARDRRRNVAILNAFGVSRPVLASAIVLEGAAYALVGVVLGTAIGVGIGTSVIEVRTEAAEEHGLTDLDLALHLRWGSVATTAVAVFAVALIVMVAIAVLPWPAVARVLRGAATRSSAPLSARVRWIGAIAAVVVFAVAARLVLQGTESLDGGALSTIGFAAIVLVVSGLAFVALACPRSLMSSIGLRYARANPRETLLVAALFAFVLFTVVAVVATENTFENAVTVRGEQFGGAASLEVSSDRDNPVPTEDVSSQPGVVRVTPYVTTQARLQPDNGSVAADVTVVGVEPGDPVAALGDRSGVVVGADLKITNGAGFPLRPVAAGDRVTLVDPSTGRARPVTVSRVVPALRWGGTSHVYAPRDVVDDLSAGKATENLLFVQTAPGTNNDVLAARIDGTHLRNGAYARSFHRLADDAVSAHEEFLKIAAAYSAAGLVAALVAVGFVMVDRVANRRRDLATLRALGARPRTLKRAVRLEALAIALTGSLVGVFSAIVVAWRLASVGAFGGPVDVAVPWVEAAGVVVVAVATSVLASTIAARRAGRLAPAPLLRGPA